MVRKILSAFSSLIDSALTRFERCLDSASDESDPSLWRLRPGAEAAFDVSPHDEADGGRDRPHIPTI